MTALITKYGQGKFSNDQDVRTYDNGYIIADPDEAYILETAGHDWALKRASGAMGISNVYSLEEDWERLSPTAIAHAEARGWWTHDSTRFNFAQAYSRQEDRSTGSGAMRRHRSCAVLSRDSGQIDVQTMMALLRDHSDGNSPNEPFQTEISPGSSICVHHNDDGGGGNTAASLVAHLCPDGSQLPVYWCSFYSPCLAVFLPMFIEGDLPSVLAVGDEHPSDDSPWWLFRQLSLAVRANGGDSIPQVRAQWKAFQNRLFVSAYDVAKEGKRLIEQGHGAEARQRLSGYMSENVEAMLEMVRQMVSNAKASTDIAAD